MLTLNPTEDTFCLHNWVKSLARVKNVLPMNSAHRGQSGCLFNLPPRRLIWKRRGAHQPHPPHSAEDDETASADEDYARTAFSRQFMTMEEVQNEK